MTPIQPLPAPVLTEVQRADLARAKRAARWLGIIGPLGVITIGVIVLLAWLPRMPDPAGTHWGFSGGPDGFGAPATFVWLQAGVGYVVVLLMGAMAAVGPMKSGQPVWGGYQRFLAAFGAGFAVFTTINNLTSAGVQLDVADAAKAPGIGGMMAVSFVSWVVVGAIVWFAQPGVTVHPARTAAQSAAQSVDAVDAGAHPSAEAGAVDAAWQGRVNPSRGYLWLVGGTVALLAAVTVLVVVLPGSERVAMAISAAVLVIVVALLATMSWFTVRIDASGLEARSRLGWPVFRLPADGIAKVETQHISPFAELGGWGVRVAPGRFGIVMRDGAGIVVTRENGKLFFITLDDAAARLAEAAAAAHHEKG
ncbi:DUF1648 domain-containing protein [Leucobacter sp. gxy201]|uniref:DUF1648 domain-containing protein n=1 Tax=Leucobacter sp. gxy201 TaxID=2957200 RepID=UPI003D9FF314